MDIVLPDDAVTLKPRLQKAINLIVQYGGIDGDHHKAWVLDQVVRILTGPEYDLLVKEARTGVNGPETYDWNVGVPP